MTSFIESEYRESQPDDGDELEWVQLPPQPITNMDIDFPGLDIGSEYDIRLREIDDRGAASPWVTLRRQVASAGDEYPLPPTGIHLIGGSCLAWSTPADAPQLDGYLVRHAPGIWATWEQMEDAHDGVVAASPFALCDVPGGVRTYAVKSLHTNGNESLTATFITAHVSDQHDALEATVEEIDEAEAGWTGDLQGAGINGATLDATGASTFPMWRSWGEPMWSADGTTPMWTVGDAPFWGQLLGADVAMWNHDGSLAMWGTRYHWIEYVWSYDVDGAFAGPGARVTVDVSVTSPNGPWRLQYRRPGGSTPMWSENGKDAMWDGDGSTAMWADINEPWQPWPGKVDAPQGGEIRFRLLVPGGTAQGFVLGVTTRLSAAIRTETQMLAIPSGGTRAKATSPFRRILSANLTEVTTGVPGVFILRDKDTSRGPWVDVHGTTTGSMLVEVRGY